MMEIGTHAEFLGVMRRVEILATYFVHDSGDTQKWRLKRHAINPFFRWMATWSVATRNPADMGYDDPRFILPELRVHQWTVEAKPLPGRLFAIDARTLQDRREARRESTTERVAAVADLVNASPHPWVVWCDLNGESNALAKAIPGSVEIKGTDSAEKKTTTLVGFTRGDIRVLVTKPSIAGFGLNWQHCSHMAFTGLSDSYEQYYQAVRRCWRFGQKNPVDVHIVISKSEGAVIENIRRKERQAEELYNGLVEHMQSTQEETYRDICA